MRLTISHADCDLLGSVVSRRSGSRRVFWAVVWFVLSASSEVRCASAASAVATPKPTPRRGGTVVVESGTDRRKPELAVVYDDTYRPPAKDLQLTLDGERKAEAAARFVNGMLIEAANTDEANDQYLKSLALDPGNAELSIKLAQDYVRRGDVPAAINLLKDTIKAAPKLARPYLALGYIYYTQQNKADLAQKFILQALDIDPTQVRGYDYLRTIYRDTDQAAKIPPLLDRAAKVDSNDAAYWLYLGKIYIEQFLTSDASFTGEPLKRTTEIFQKAFAAGRDDAELANKVGDFYLATKQYAEAIPIYERVIEIDPGQVPPRENLARCYIASEQPDKATDALEGLIKVNPVDAHAYETLAKLYETSGKLDKAIVNYEQSLLLNPNYVEGYENVTDLLVRQNQAEKAVPLLMDARKRFPNQPVFTFLLAISLERAKQYAPALETFEQTETEAQSTMPVLLDSKFYFEFGRTAEQAALYDRAGTLLRKALATAGDSRRIALISNYLGYMWVDHNLNLEEGGDLIKHALELDPDNGAYLDSLGWYCYRTGKFDQAAEWLSKAIAVTKPEDETVAEVYGHLGDTYFKLNDTGKAVEAWQKAADLDPKSPDLPGLTKKIADAKAAPAPAAPGK